MLGTRYGAELHSDCGLSFNFILPKPQLRCMRNQVPPARRFNLPLTTVRYIDMYYATPILKPSFLWLNDNSHGVCWPYKWFAAYQIQIWQLLLPSGRKPVAHINVGEGDNMASSWVEKSLWSGLNALRGQSVANYKREMEFPGENANFCCQTMQNNQFSRKKT